MYDSDTRIIGVIFFFFLVFHVQPREADDFYVSAGHRLEPRGNCVRLAIPGSPAGLHTTVTTERPLSSQGRTNERIINIYVDIMRQMYYVDLQRENATRCRAFTTCKNKNKIKKQ